MLQGSEIKTERNDSINITRVICAILVVSIHAQPFNGISDSINYYDGNVISRIAVPFFFIVSGYYYCILYLTCGSFRS